MTTAHTSSKQATTNDGGAAGGRVAMREMAELLLLRERPVLVGVAVVVVLGLLLTFLAPSAVPSTFLVGAVVGILALIAGVAMALVVDGSDPVLRGPRHLRRDGVPVLGWLPHATVPPESELLDAVVRRVEANGRTRLVLVDAGGDVRTLGRSLADQAATRGLTSLLVDLRDLDRPAGIADVQAGRMKLGEAAVIAQGRPFAAIGAGGAPQASAEAAVALLQRPPSDLQLVVVVAADEPEGGGGLHTAADRVVMIVSAETSRRADVRTLTGELRAAGATVEAVVIGGRQLDADATDDASTGAPAGAKGVAAAAAGVATAGAAAVAGSSDTADDAAPVLDEADAPDADPVGSEPETGGPEAIEQPPLAPVVERVPEPVVEPVVAEASEPVVEPVVAEASEPVVEPVVAEASEPILEPVAEESPEPVAEEAPEPIVEPLPEAVAEPVVEPVAEPAVKSAPEPVVEESSEPVAEAEDEPVAETEAEDEPVVEDEPEPAVESPVESAVAEVASEAPVVDLAEVDLALEADPELQLPPAATPHTPVAPRLDPWSPDEKPADMSGARAASSTSATPDRDSSSAITPTIAPFDAFAAASPIAPFAPDPAPLDLPAVARPAVVDAAPAVIPAVTPVVDPTGPLDLVSRFTTASTATPKNVPDVGETSAPASRSAFASTEADTAAKPVAAEDVAASSAVDPFAPRSATSAAGSTSGDGTVSFSPPSQPPAVAPRPQTPASSAFASPSVDPGQAPEAAADAAAASELAATANAELAALVDDDPSPDSDLLAVAAMEMLAQDLSDDS